MRLHILQLGLVGPNDRGMTVGTPCPGYLIRMDDGTNVLVDTGLPLPEPEADPPFWASWLDAQDSVISRLAELGLVPRDIALLVCTHFDFDHAGRHDAFPEAELIVQRRHYEAAREHPRFAATRPQWDRPDRRWRYVEGDSDPVPRCRTDRVERACAGPPVGARAAARDGAGPAGHRRHRPRQPPDPETRPIQGADMDEAGVRASTRKLVDLARREAATLIVQRARSRTVADPQEIPRLLCLSAARPISGR